MAPDVGFGGILVNSTTQVWGSAAAVEVGVCGGLSLLGGAGFAQGGAEFLKPAENVGAVVGAFVGRICEEADGVPDIGSPAFFHSLIELSGEFLNGLAMR